jgi:HSP20 family molecular chaperone IbpA
MNNFFDDFFENTALANMFVDNTPLNYTVRCTEARDKYWFAINVANFDKKYVKVTVNDKTLKVYYDKKAEKEDKESSLVYNKELYPVFVAGSNNGDTFSKEFTFPTKNDIKVEDAQIVDGMLYITVGVAVNNKHEVAIKLL